jgi:hypothetical protein
MRARRADRMAIKVGSHLYFHYSRFLEKGTASHDFREREGGEEGYQISAVAVCLLIIGHKFVNEYFIQSLSLGSLVVGEVCCC